MWGQRDAYYPPALFGENAQHEYAGALFLFEVYSLTFANIKEASFAAAMRKLNEIFVELYQKHAFLKNSGLLRDKEIQYFDSGNKPSGEEPEWFYHGFVLGLLVELRDKYVITSNRESGYGRYDILMEPRTKGDAAIIIEFKVFDEAEEESLQDAVQKALKQIQDKEYAQALISKGIPQ